jgi:hypothetical protein
MPKRITPLSEVNVRTAKPQEHTYKIFDGGGLFLLVTPSGGKLWHFKYRFDKKEKKLTFGPYPEISLADARQRRDEARNQVCDPDMAMVKPSGRTNKKLTRPVVSGWAA